MGSAPDGALYWGVLRTEIIQKFSLKIIQKFDWGVRLKAYLYWSALTGRNLKKI